MDTGFSRAIEVLSSNRAAFELLLREKRQLRQELVTVFTSANAVWKQLPGGLTEEQRLEFLNKLILKYLAEIDQNQVFVDEQLLRAVQDAEIADREKRHQSDMAALNEKHAAKQDKLRNELKQQEQLNQVCEQKLKTIKNQLRGIVAELEQTAAKAIDVKDIAGILAESKKVEKLRSIPGEINTAVTKIVNLLT